MVMRRKSSVLGIAKDAVDAVGTLPVRSIDGIEEHLGVDFEDFVHIPILNDGEAGELAEKEDNLEVVVDRRERETLVVNGSVYAHPDTILRRLGIIHQKAYCKPLKQTVELDPRKRRWMTTETQPPRALEGLEHRGITNKEDTAPKGVIYLVGNVDLKSLKTESTMASQASVQEMVRPSLEEVVALLQFRVSKQAERERAEAAAEIAAQAGDETNGRKPGPKPSAAAQSGATRGQHSHGAGHESESSSDDDADELAAAASGEDSLPLALRLAKRELAKRNNDRVAAVEEEDSEDDNLDFEADGNFLTNAEVAQTIRQFLTRSIPNAALATSSVIMTSQMDGDFLDVVGEGVARLHSEGNAQHIDASLVAVTSTDAVRYSELLPSTTHYYIGHDGNGNRVRQFALDQCLRSMIMELAAGYRRKKFDEDGEQRPVLADEPPDRDACKVATVVLGGGRRSVPFALQMSVEKEWPIFIVEGSGGYADHFAKLYRHAQSIMDDDKAYRCFTSALDSGTAEVIRRGHVYLVPRGEVVDSFTHSLTYALKGDATLRKAWEKYALWRSNALMYRRIFSIHLFILLAVGILATGLSIFQTFAQLHWPEDTLSDGATTNSGIGKMYQYLNLVVIFLPIMMQLMQSITNKVAAGSKMAVLRWASESVGKEIYTFRTHTGDYSKEAVHAAAQRVELKRRANEFYVNEDGVMVKEEVEETGLEDYSSRQELLHLRLERVTKELAESEVSELNLKEYKGTVPPAEILEVGDDGFSDLTSQEYVQVRLHPLLQWYTLRAVRWSKQKTFLEVCVHSLNTVGTLLAALATQNQLQEYNLQAWVAFTTAIVSALTRFEHWMMLEWLHEKHNKTMLELSNVVTWWTSRGERADFGENKNRLVVVPEDIVEMEVREFRQQAKANADDVKKAGEELLDIADEAAKKINPEAEALSKKAEEKMNQLQIGNMSLANMMEAINDPSSKSAEMTKKVLGELNRQFGDVISQGRKRAQMFAKSAVKATDGIGKIDSVYYSLTDGTIAEELQNAAGELVMPSMLGVFEVRRVIPQCVWEMIHDPRRRRRFLEPLLSGAVAASEVSRKVILRLAKGVDRKMDAQFRAMPQRMLLETTKRAVQEELAAVYVSGLATVGISVHELVENRARLPDLLTGMAAVAAAPWRDLGKQIIAQLILDDEIRTKVLQWNDSKFRLLMKRSEAVLVQPTTLNRLLLTVDDEIATLDIYNHIANTDEKRIALLPVIQRLEAVPFDMAYLGIPDIVDVLGLSCDRAMFSGADHSLLVAIVRNLEYGFPLTQQFETFLMNRNGYIDKAKMDAALQTPVRRDEFMFAVEEISQVLIFKSNKQRLLRRFMSMFVVSKTLIDGLRMAKEDVLKATMCALRYSLKCGYCAMLFTMLSDEITTFDVEKMLTYEEELMLIDRMKEFVPYMSSKVDLSCLTKQRMLSMIGFNKITNKLEGLYDYQLQDMLQRVGNFIHTSIFRHTFLAVKAAFFKRHGVRYEAFDRLQDDVVMLDRLFLSLSKTDPRRMAAMLRNQRAELHDFIDDPEAEMFVVKAGITPPHFVTLCELIATYSTGLTSAMMFHSVARELHDPDLYNIFSAVFSSIDIREEFLLMVRVGIEEHNKQVKQALASQRDQNMRIENLEKIAREAKQRRRQRRKARKAKNDQDASQPGEDDVVEMFPPGPDDEDDDDDDESDYSSESSDSGMLLDDGDDDDQFAFLRHVSHVYQFSSFVEMSNDDLVEWLLELNVSGQAGKSSFSAIVRELRRVFGDSFHTVYTLMLAKVLNSINYFAFQSCATRVNVCDLRGVVQGSMARQQFVPLMVHLHHERLIMEDSTATLQELKAIFSDPYVRKHFHEVAEDLRMVPPAYMNAIIQRVLGFLTESGNSGSKLCHLVFNTQVLAADLDETQNKQPMPFVKLAVAVSNITNLAKREPHLVRSQLDFFDERQFQSRARAERCKMLGKLFPSEDLAKEVADWSEEVLASFFAFVMALPLFAGAAGVKENQGTTKKATESKASMARKMQAVSAFLNAARLMRNNPFSKGPKDGEKKAGPMSTSIFNKLRQMKAAGGDEPPAPAPMPESRRMTGSRRGSKAGSQAQSPVRSESPAPQED